VRSRLSPSSHVGVWKGLGFVPGEGSASVGVCVADSIDIHTCISIHVFLCVHICVNR